MAGGDSPRWYWHKVPRIFFNLSDILLKINFFRLLELCFPDEFPPDEQNREDANHGVGKEEGRNAPVSRKEDSVAANEGHGECTSQRIPSQIRLKASLVR